MQSGGEPFPRYCLHCGASFDASLNRCPVCGLAWSTPALPAEPRTLAAVLTEFQALLQQGLIDDDTYRRLRAHYEARLAAVRRPLPASGEEGVPPPKDTGFDFTIWAAQRQADILLYLGAFLLVMSALIFVSYQGQAMPGGARIAVLAALTVAFVIFGLLVRRWERVREAGHVFLALGALFTPLNFILLYTEFFSDGGRPAELLWLFGSLYCLAFYGTLVLRDYGRLYAVPAGIALNSAWGALAALLDLPPEWIGAWYASLAAGGALVVAVRRQLPSWLLRPIGGLALLAIPQAHIATVSDAHHLQLAATYAIVTAGIVTAGWGRRIIAALPAAATAALATVLALLWAAGAPTEWHAYPILLWGALAVGSRPLWAHWHPGLARFGWAYAAVLAIAATAFWDTAPTDSWHGALTLALAAGVLAATAWLDREGDLIDAVPGDAFPSPFAERAVLGWSAAALGLGAVGAAQRTLGVSVPDTGWAFLAISVATALSMSLPRLRSDTALRFLLPVSLASLYFAGGEDYPRHNAAVAAIAATAYLLAFAVTVRGTFAIVAVALAALATAEFWDTLDYPAWRLALAYSAAGVALFALLTPRRGSYEGTWGPVIILSWGLCLLGALTAVAALFLRLDTEPGIIVVQTVEYRTLTGLILVFAPLVAYETLRLRRPAYLVGAGAIAMVATLMAIAIAEPANVQVYTVPSALYLLATGLFIRRSEPLIPLYVRQHEAAIIAGAALLLLPQAEQSFEPDGALWGLVMIGESVAFLAIAFLLQARWLLVAAVLTLTAVAIRWLAESGDTVPYWLTLGIVGIGLLALGLWVLQNRTWWDRVRLALSDWWQESDHATA